MGIFSIRGLIDRAPAPAITAQRREDRTTDELIGLCRGILADGHISSDEARYLAGWLERNAACVNRYPYSTLLLRLRDALVDGVVDEDEERDLLFAVTRLVGGEAEGDRGSESASLSSTLPLTEPAPTPITHTGAFVVTGTFDLGPRAHIIQQITSRGGTVYTAVSKKIDYLVIGTVGSRDWIHSSYGRKIEKAIQLREDGVPICIVAERHWAAHL